MPGTVQGMKSLLARCHLPGFLLSHQVSPSLRPKLGSWGSFFRDVCRDEKRSGFETAPFQGLRKPKLSEEMVPEKTSCPCGVGKGATDDRESQPLGMVRSQWICGYEGRRKVLPREVAEL